MLEIMLPCCKKRLLKHTSKVFLNLIYAHHLVFVDRKCTCRANSIRHIIKFEGKLNTAILT